MAIAADLEWQCDLKIKVTPYTITSYSGGSINISGDISDSSGKPITWTIRLPNGQTIPGSGSPASASWDGKDANGKLLKPDQSYSATIKAQSSDGCSDTKQVPITVSPWSDGNSCGLQVQVGSSANVANGNLSHSQDLFSSRGGALPLAMTLYYNSLDSNDGSLGRSWSHSYDVSLTQNNDRSVLLKEGNFRRRLFTLSNGSYVSQPGDYSTLVKNSDNTFTLTEKDGTRYNFGVNGEMTSIVDRNGNADTFVYNGGNLTGITDPGGRTSFLSYDGNNHLVSVTDPSGNNYSLTYAGGTLATVTYPDGGAWRYTYDDKAFMLSKTDPMGNATSYGYDDKHRLVSSTDPEGKTRSIDYPTGTDRVKSTAFTEKDGGIWQYTYDTEKGTLNQKTDPQGGTTSYTYDGSGNRLSITEPDGSTTSFTYDAQGNQTSMTDSLGQTTEYAHNDFGQVTSVKDPQGNTTTYAYDANGNLTATTDPAGATTQYRYDSKGNISEMVNPLGQTATFTYDSNGNLASVTDSAGATTTFTYDAAGNMISQADPNGATTQFEYNAKNQIVKITDPKGNVTTYVYDLAGNKVSETDANGNTTFFEYNAKGQVVKTKNAMGKITMYAYGGAGCASCGAGTDKLTSLTDANGNATTYQYDTLGRLLSETDPLGNVTIYSYDAKGNLVAKTDANGNTIQFSYDSLGRLLKKLYPDNTEEIFTYDAKGNILTATNKNISYSFTYDGAGKVLSVTDSNGRVVQYDYDIAGRKTKTIYPEGSVVTYGYDTAGKLAKITNGGGRTYTFEYDKLGRRSKLAYPNGTTANYSYDNAGRLTSLAHKSSRNQTIYSFTYTHDKVGNRLSKTEPDGKTNYSYDKLYQLTQAKPNKPWDKTEQYDYDPVGNRLSGPRDRLQYLYNQGNQLTERTGQLSGLFPNLLNKLIPGHQNHGKVLYEYDKNGNLIKKVEPEGLFPQKTTTLYTYDHENRLIQVEIQRGHKAKIVTFTYDPFGRRLSKSVHREEIDDEDSNGCAHGRQVPRSTFYVYDNEDIILEYDERGRVDAKYVPGPGIDEPLALYRKGESYYYHADGLGSIVALTDKRGHVVQKYEYDSFGNIEKQTPAVLDQPYAYTGREWDKETGLYYYRARYYDSLVGRFISKDPIEFAGGDVNLYGYVSNNPVNRVDPMGLAYTTVNQFDSGINTVVCDGAGHLTEILENPYNTPCIEDCLQAHEICHKKDILKRNPKICKGKLFHQAIRNPNRSKLVSAEMSAYMIELKCLREKLKKPINCDCKQEIQDRINDINNLVFPQLRNGQLPQ